MSLALYRKYRPATFAEVRGQEHVTVPLAQALRNGRVHHAYLFSGPRGCGKTSSARILARSLNCEQGPTPEPCGRCEPCVALAPSGPGSLDVIEIDAASHGGVDDARDLRERAFFAPATSRYKIYIIDEAHMVTREGFNALLKLVEEPPPHLKFVFATTEPEKVIGTIKSRTHHYPFRLLAPGTLRAMLEEVLREEDVPHEPAALPLVVRAAGGSARDALSVLDQLVAGADESGITYARAVALLGYTDAGLLDEIVDAFAAGDGATVFAAVDRVIEGGHDPRRFTADLLERFRDLVVLNAVRDADSSGLLDVPPDALERMREQASAMGPAELSRAADLFYQGLTEMRGATSPRLLLELLCARVLLPGASRDETALLARLDRLERGFPAAPPANTGLSPGLPSPSAATSRGAEPAAAEAVRAQPTTQPTTQPAAQLSTQPATQPTAPASHPEARRPGSIRPDSTRPDSTRPESARPAPHRGEGDRGGSSRSGPRPPSDAAPSRGELDVGMVRQAWPNVLEAVKRRRRVAWMILINDVEIADVSDGSLTLAFARDGDMKGFTSSGSDRVVQQAVAEVLGAELRVHAITGGAPGGSAGSRRRGEPAPPAGARGARPPAGAGRAAPGASGAAEGAGTEEPPDVDPDGDVDVDPGVTGMALIQRELGGQIIEEIEDP